MHGNLAVTVAFRSSRQDLSRYQTTMWVLVAAALFAVPGDGDGPRFGYAARPKRRDPSLGYPPRCAISLRPKGPHTPGALLVRGLPVLDERHLGANALGCRRDWVYSG